MLGVLLVNTGTPDAPRAPEVRRFLARFLSDPRVVELPRLLWQPLLRGVILPVRGPRSARNYEKVWMPGGSPLSVHQRALAAALQEALAAQAGGARVADCYLYSNPGVGEAFAALRESGATRFVVLPLYPQCSGTTTGAVYDQVGDVMRTLRAMPDLRLVGDYHVDAGYIGALAASVREHWQAQGRQSHLLMSFHGIPVRCVRMGDPYEAQCHGTAQALVAALGLADGDWTISFQSRFGSEKWLGPATDSQLAELPARGVRELSVVCPGFGVDCLETLEEIAIGGRETFEHAGGTHFSYVPALNSRADHAAALARVVLDARGTG
jgi:protoporphyrin/coproporphyrin ferrochelatase